MFIIYEHFLKRVTTVLTNCSYFWHLQVQTDTMLHNKVYKVLIVGYKILKTPIWLTSNLFVQHNTYFCTKFNEVALQFKLLGWLKTCRAADHVSSYKGSFYNIFNGREWVESSRVASIKHEVYIASIK